MSLVNGIEMSATLGSAALGVVGSVVSDYLGRWLAVCVKTSDVAMTNFEVEYQISNGGGWIPQLASTDWADPDNFDTGEQSGTDDQGNGHYVYNLGIGEFTMIRLNVTGVYAVRFSATGNGATVTIKGFILG